MSAARSDEAAPRPPREADAGATVRLFVALWPDARVRAALVDSAAQWAWQPGTALERAQRLHLTLHFLGDVTRDRVEQLRDELALPLRPFSLSLARPTLWSGGIAVLEPEQMPAPLADLHAALSAVLRRLGLRTEARAFRPHVTLARRAAGAVAPARVACVDWRVDGYVLAASRGAVDYAVVQRYAAAAEPSLERGQRAEGEGPLQ